MGVCVAMRVRLGCVGGTPAPGGTSLEGAGAVKQTSWACRQHGDCVVQIGDSPSLSGAMLVVLPMARPRPTSWTVLAGIARERKLPSPRSSRPVGSGLGASQLNRRLSHCSRGLSNSAVRGASMDICKGSSAGVPLPRDCTASHLAQPYT